MSRLFYLTLFAVGLSLLGFGLYLEYVQGLDPCPLCIFQRLAFIGVIVIALIAAIHNPSGILRQGYNGLLIMTALTGASIAGRQTWLQHLPPEQVPACGPGLDYMLEVFPLAEVLKIVFTGSGECAEVQWTFLTLSIAEWSLVCFMTIIIATLFAAFKIKPVNT